MDELINGLMMWSEWERTGGPQKNTPMFVLWMDGWMGGLMDGWLHHGWMDCWMDG